MLNICVPSNMDVLPGDEALRPLTGLEMPCIGQMQRRDILPAPRAADELTDSRYLRLEGWERCHCCKRSALMRSRCVFAWHS